jgi:hypothetical protein
MAAFFLGMLSALFCAAFAMQVLDIDLCRNARCRVVASKCQSPVAIDFHAVATHLSGQAFDMSQPAILAEYRPDF